MTTVPMRRDNEDTGTQRDNPGSTASPRPGEAAADPACPHLDPGLQRPGLGDSVSRRRPRMCRVVAGPELAEPIPVPPTESGAGPVSTADVLFRTRSGRPCDFLFPQNCSEPTFLSFEKFCFQGLCASSSLS